MAKATEVVYKYYEGGFAVKHRKDGFKASLSEVLLGYQVLRCVFRLRQGERVAYYTSISHERNAVLAKNTVQDRGSNAITCG